MAGEFDRVVRAVTGRTDQAADGRDEILPRALVLERQAPMELPLLRRGQKFKEKKR